MVASGATPLNVFAYTGTIGTFGYMLGYLLMAIALPFFLRRRGEFNPLSAVLAVVVAAALLYVFYKNVYPGARLPAQPAAVDLRRPRRPGHGLVRGHPHAQARDRSRRPARSRRSRSRRTCITGRHEEGTGRPAAAAGDPERRL